MDKATVVKIGKLSGRAVFCGVRIAAQGASMGFKAADKVLGTANSMANSFVGGGIGGTPMKDAAMGGIQWGLKKTIDFSKWADKKLRA